jgi:hypothetical protein
MELREKGYSFKAIFDELVEAGFFPEDADPKYLCQAFSRERKRREAKTAWRRTRRSAD